MINTGNQDIKASQFVANQEGDVFVVDNDFVGDDELRASRVRNMAEQGEEISNNLDLDVDKNDILKAVKEQAENISTDELQEMTNEISNELGQSSPDADEVGLSEDKVKAIKTHRENVIDEVGKKVATVKTNIEKVQAGEFDRIIPGTGVKPKHKQIAEDVVDAVDTEVDIEQVATQAKLGLRKHQMAEDELRDRLVNRFGNN